MSLPVSFAIRHKPTGHFIPQATGFKGRGGSHVEPCDPSEKRPKFFKSKSIAKGWLTTWLRGKITVSSGLDYYGEYDEHWIVTKVPSRRFEDMEIVTIKHEVVNDTPPGN